MLEGGKELEAVKIMLPGSHVLLFGNEDREPRGIEAFSS